MTGAVDPSPLPDPGPPPLRPRRAITGMSAVLLPWRSPTEVDWAGFEAHLERTIAAGLVPAVNMDTGFVQLLDDTTRARVLEIAAASAPGGFVGGAFVPDRQGATFDLAAYQRAVAAVASAGGTPIVFPSWGLNALAEPEWIEAHRAIATGVDRFLGFELGPMFVPYGRIVSIDAYRALLDIPQCTGAKHSSLRRDLEWERLAARDAHRPDFSVLTGNDHAIDMVMWGSDYLLGLSTFAPEAFAARDRCWAQGDGRFHALNDALAYLGRLAFRTPVPAYRHDAAMFLHLRGWIAVPEVPAGAPRRDAWEVELLADALAGIEAA